MMKRKIIVVSILAGFTISGIVGYYFYNDVTKPTSEEEKAAVAFVEEAFEDVALPEEKVKSLDVLYSDDLEEYKVQNIIHNMSHQKVKAEEKWGHIQITKPKVDRLLEVVKANVDHYDHEDTYIKTLERWVEGDFSKAVEDHNAVWKLQGGNVGEAYRLLTPVEEWRYIEQHFVDKK